MNTASPQTPKNIRRCAAKEFAEKGFRGASLRNIVKQAGVTTGAFYGYYNSKEELFDAIVGEHAHRLIDIFVTGQKKLLEAIKNGSVEDFRSANHVRLTSMIEIACENSELTKLILLSSEGTKYEGFIHSMAEAEIQATCRLRAQLRSDGAKQLDPYFEHIILSGMISSLFEPVIHNASRERCTKLAGQLSDFYSEGLSALMFP